MSGLYDDQLQSFKAFEEHIIRQPEDSRIPDNQIKSAVLHRDLHKKSEKVSEASGLYLILSDGRRIIDATGGAAVSCIGHGDTRVRDVIADQGCSWQRLGSEAMDGAVKLARQYFLELSPPQPRRTRFIAREGSYHGNTLGALSISGHKARRSIYEPMLASNVSHVSACNSYRGMKAHETVEAYVATLSDELECEFQRVDPQAVCAFVAEPVVGYFKAMKSVCDRHGALLILDEVMCGMGRTGSAHAWQQEGVVPDIQTIGKGLGGGYVPVAGFLAGHRVINALHGGTGQFIHGHTYQAHPMVCAAALEVQRIIQQENLVANVAAMGAVLETKLRNVFSNHPNIGDIRGRGLFWGVSHDSLPNACAFADLNDPQA
ncbi:MAG: hypothetical protein Q9195_007188 [Heterodermia aff. obscurata]